MTEYRLRLPHHSEPFTTEIEYLTEGEVTNQLHELLCSYQQLCKPRPSEISNEVRVHIEHESSVALKVLQSIFPHAKEVSPSVLRRSTTDKGFEIVLNGLKSLAKSLVWPAGARDGKWISTAANAKECNDNVGAFMENGIWPLIKIARYGFMLSSIL